MLAINAVAYEKVKCFKFGDCLRLRLSTYMVMLLQVLIESHTYAIHVSHICSYAFLCIELVMIAMLRYAATKKI